jgi:hypothetical protein
MGQAFVNMVGEGAQVSATPGARWRMSGDLAQGLFAGPGFASEGVVPPFTEDRHWRKWWYEEELNDMPIGVQVMRDIGQYIQSEQAVESSVPQGVLYS